MRTGQHLLCLLCLSVAACFVSCQSDSGKSANDESGRVTDLYIRYLEGERKVKAVAEFKLRDSAGVTTPDSFAYKVWFQGRAMQSLTEHGRQGYFNLELDYAQPGTFEFTVEGRDGNTRSFAYELRMKDSLAPLSFTKSKGLEVQLGERGLDNKESLVVVATDAMQASASSVSMGPGKGTLIFVPTQFEPLQEGPVSLYFVWKSRRDSTVDGRTVHADLEYYLREHQIPLSKE